MPGAVEIWSIDLDAAAPELLALEAEAGLMAAQDRAAVANLIDPAAAVRRLAASIGLRVLLSGLEGREIATRPFVRGANGKPGLPGAGHHFNITHSGPAALIALSSHPVGIDLERLRPVRMESRRRRLIEAAALAVADGAPITGRSDEQRFLQAWTRLEALAKADGCGIGRLLTEIGAVGPRRNEDEGPPSAWLQALAAAHETQDLVLEGDAIGAVSASREAIIDAVPRRLPSIRTALEALLKRPRTIGGA